ncbi:gp436 family protein [Paenirhodobacter sp.]|jgi:phage gp36-like protein|uniref:gp436 family protein n=1 Tax=Paenirhodobacter sp. TaxID=1965326 RepID=UPI003B5002B9
MYAALDDLIERAGDVEIRSIADRDRDGIADPAVIEAALQDADNLVNTYIGAKYPVPLASTPPIVRTWATSIARYVLHRNGAPDHVEADYKDAIAALKDVARGTATLPVLPGDDAINANSGTVMAAHPPQVFTPDRLRGWR